MIIVSDSSPINYLVLVGEIEVLPKLFGSVFVPPAVFSELTREKAPLAVRNWLNTNPSWLHVQAPKSVYDAKELGRGECEAISLAEELKADELLIDDKAARKVALARGLSVTGTLTVLAEAGERGLLDLPKAIERLHQTNFRMPEHLVREILRRQSEKK